MICHPKSFPPTDVGANFVTYAFADLCMKTVFLSLILVSISLRAFSQTAEPDFELVRENKEERITIYERWITFPGSQPPIKAREVKGDFFIRTTIPQALALLKNEKKIYQWQSHVSEFKVYVTSDSTTWDEYSYHDIPWPVSDQDHFLEYTIQPDSGPEKLFIIFKSKVNRIVAPVRDDATRMELYGTWMFEKLTDTEIRASYTILSKPMNIPRIFTDPVIRSNLMSTIKSYIGILEGRE